MTYDDMIIPDHGIDEGKSAPVTVTQKNLPLRPVVTVPARNDSMTASLEASCS